jgi:hypothetical protein
MRCFEGGSRFLNWLQHSRFRTVAEQLKQDQADLEKAVESGMESYSKEKTRGFQHNVLAADMDYERL